MILICELSMEDGAHVPFNAGFLATIRAAFPTEDLSFVGAAAHIEELKQEVGHPLASSISWRQVTPPSRRSGYGSRFVRELEMLRGLLNNISHASTSRLVLTSAQPSTVLALKVARWFGSNHPPVQIVLHWLSGVVGKRYRRPIRRLQDMKTALSLLGNWGIQYVVLEQSIRDRVEKSLPFLSDKVVALDHPISPNEGESQSIDFSEPFRFGFLGLANKQKGYPLFLELANHITARYGRRAEFHAVGRCPQNGAPVNGTEVLATKPRLRRMTRADFVQGVTPLHYIVLPHEATRYALAASGVLLDAIAWGKPVIARKIPIFEAMFQRHGDIGYLFSEDAELKYIVEQILQTADKSRYYAQVLNLRTARKSRAPETLAASYRDICRKNGQAL